MKPKIYEYIEITECTIKLDKITFQEIIDDAYEAGKQDANKSGYNPFTPRTPVITDPWQPTWVEVDKNAGDPIPNPYEFTCKSEE